MFHVQCASLLIMLFLQAVGGESVSDGERTPLAPVVGDGPFLFVTEVQTRADDFGLVMVCPAHAHGTPEQALAKLELLLESSSCSHPAIAICRQDQIQILRMFSPVVKRIILNPFLPQGEDYKPGLPWLGQNHPRLNHLRAARQAAGSARLLALVDVNGECTNMTFSVQDIKWLVCSVVGSGYQGVVWRGTRGDPQVMQALLRFQRLFSPYLGQLAQARPVDWVSRHDGVLASALLGDGKLFVVLLQPAWLTYKTFTDYRPPLDLSRCSAVVELSPGATYQLKSARTLSGHSVLLRGRCFECPVVDGCEIVIVDVENKDQPATQSP